MSSGYSITTVVGSGAPSRPGHATIQLDSPGT
jgi:hypothetical protein